ncbi:unnamed protein product [Closterium sp. NIES-54]
MPCPSFVPSAIHSLTPPSPLSVLFVFPLPSIPSPRHPISLPLWPALSPVILSPCCYSLSRHSHSLPFLPSPCPCFLLTLPSFAFPAVPSISLPLFPSHSAVIRPPCPSFPLPASVSSSLCRHFISLPFLTSLCPCSPLSLPPFPLPTFPYHYSLFEQYRAMVYSCPDCPATGFTTRGNVTNHRYGGRCPGNARHAAAANSGNPFLMTRHNAASMPSPTLSIPSPTPSIPSPTLSMPSPPRAAVDPEPLRGNEGSTHDNMVPDSFHPAPAPSNSVESTPDVLPDDATSVHTNGEAECSTNDGDESPSFVFLDAFVHWLLTCGVSKKKVDELLQIFNHHGACLEQLRKLRNMRDVEKYADDHAPDAHRNWKKAKVAPLVESGDVASFKDPHLDAPDDLLLRLARLALTCTAMPMASRPTMGRVLGDLLGMKEEVIGGAEVHRDACRIDREFGSSAAHTVNFDAQLAGIEQMGVQSNLSGDA